MSHEKSRFKAYIVKEKDMEQSEASDCTSQENFLHKIN